MTQQVQHARRMPSPMPVLAASLRTAADASCRAEPPARLCHSFRRGDGPSQSCNWSPDQEFPMNLTRANPP